MLGIGKWVVLFVLAEMLWEQKGEEAVADVAFIAPRPASGWFVPVHGSGSRRFTNMDAHSRSRGAMLEICVVWFIRVDRSDATTMRFWSFRPTER